MLEEIKIQEETLRQMKVLMHDAVRDGLRETINEETIEAFWAGGVKMLQRQASEHAGRFVLGGIMGIARKLSLFLMLGGVVYALGGWTALAALGKTLFHSGGAP